MATAKIGSFQGLPCVTFQVDGGVLGWQDWMSNSLAIYPEFVDGEPASLTVFSFQAGAPLATVPITVEQYRSLAPSQFHVLSSADLGEDQAAEGILVKAERFDRTGRLIEGIRLQTQGKLAEAIDAYRQAFQETPGIQRAANLIGLCCRFLERPAEAEEWYLKETEIAAHTPDPYYNLGMLYQKTNREKMARTMFEKALDRDQFHLNSLLHFSRMLARSDERKSRLANSLNLRLLVGFAELPQIQEHLFEMSRLQGVTPQDFVSHLRAESGPLCAPPVLQLMKRLEMLRLNGGFIALVRGFSLLLEKTAGGQLEKFFLHWCARRLNGIKQHLPEILVPHWEAAIEELNARFPGLGKQETAAQAPSTHRTEALTAEELFGLVLLEILRDGQIKSDESQMIFRLKNALRIDENAHRRIFAKVEASLKANPLVDDGAAFDPRRLFRQILLAVMRDGKIDPEERKLLAIASEALELLPEEMKKIVDGVKE